MTDKTPYFILAAFWMLFTLATALVTLHGPLSYSQAGVYIGVAIANLLFLGVVSNE